MTEPRPHFRSRNSIHPKVIFNLSSGERLTQKERETIQYSNMPDTVFGRAALACYDGVDTSALVGDKDEKILEVVEPTEEDVEPEPEFPQD